MTYTSALSSAGGVSLVSPINPSEVFDENDSMNSSNSEEDHPEFSDLPAMGPSSTSPILPQTSSSHIHNRSFRNFTRFIRRRQARHQAYVAGSQSPSMLIDTEIPPWQESSQCLIHQVNELKWNNSNSISSSSYYFLLFKIISNDGGCYSPAYDIHNLLKNDSSVYCSGRTGTVNISLKYCGGRVLMDTTCVLDRIIIRSPGEGFTAPCKEGLVFISHKAIDVEKTRQFDRFTKRDYDAYLTSIDKLNMDDHNPVAWFNTFNQVQQVIPINQRSGKYILIKLLRSDDNEENIDLEYIGFVGYAGARSFASSPCLL